MKMKKAARATIFLFAILSFPCSLVAQNTIGADPDTIITEGLPEFPGGHQAMCNFISENLNYPRKAQINGIEGKVIVEFVVTHEGEIKDVKVVNKVDPLLAKAAIKVVKKMPKWTPGTQGGKPVNVRYHLPINFNLED